MQRRWKGLFSRFAGMIGLLLLLVATMSGNAGKAVAAEPRRGGAMTVGVDLEFRGFDPLKVVYLQPGDRSVVMAIEERLFGMDRNRRLVPELALSATASEDGKSWTMKLREGVSFHDGTPFNADAVIEHWQRILAPENSYSGASYIEPVESVAKIDNYTVLFVLKHPWAAFLTMLSSTQLTEAFIPSPQSMRDNRQNRAPVGTGPFIFKEWLAKDRLVVVRNPTYWQKGLPYLDSITFRPLPDIEARFSGLISGQTDIILTDLGSQILQAEKDRSLKVYHADTSGSYTFIINTDKSPLNDLRVRRALAHAWDQDLYLKSDFQESRPFVKNPFGGTPFCSDRAYREYDPTTAKQLLAEYGQPVELELLETDNPRGIESGKIMQKLFRDIGVALKVTRLSESQLVERVMDGDYEIAGWRMMDLNDLGPYLNACLHSEGRLNFSHYQNPAMDELLLTLRRSTDEQTRMNALCKIADVINDDAIYLYAGGRRFHAIAKASVQGIAPFDQGIVLVSKNWIQVKGEKTEKIKKAPAMKKGKKTKKTMKVKKGK